MKKLTLALGLLIPLLLAHETSRASTNVCGPILVNTTWNLAGSPYIVTCSIIVGNSATLTIDPGVTVCFQHMKGMIIGDPAWGVGTLMARGTALLPILFTSCDAQPAAGDWAYIKLDDLAVDAQLDPNDNYLSGSILEYCTIEYGGYGSVPMLDLQHSVPFINHCELRFSASTGLNGNLNDGGAGLPLRLVMTNNNIHHCVGHAAYVGEGWGHLIKGNTLSNTSSGRGLRVYSAANPEVVGNEVRDNSGGSNGTGVEVYECPDATISDNTIQNSDTSADYGGGLYVRYCSDSEISRNVIAGNRLTGGYNYGGGLAVLDSSNVLVEGNEIVGNEVVVWWTTIGGGAFIKNCANVVIRNNHIVDNDSGADTAGVRLETCGGAVVENNRISNNYAVTYNGGLSLHDCSSAQILQNRITSNSAGQDTGGLGVSLCGNSIIKGNTIMNNVATDDLGGVWIAASSEGTIVSENRIAGNVATNRGGGLFISSASVALTENVIVLNAAAKGGGIYVDKTASGLVMAGDPVSNTFNTLAGNTATQGTAVFYNRTNGSGVLAATYVCWGTTDLSLINDPMIWDFFDDANLDMVTYLPIATCDPFYDMGGGVEGVTGIPSLLGTGTLLPGSPTLVSLTNGAPQSLMIVLIGFVPIYYGYLDGIVVPLPAVVVWPLATDASGNLNMPFNWPVGLPSGAAVFWQAMIADSASSNGVASFSNSLYSVVP